MAKLSAGQIYQQLVQVGYTPAAAVIQTAIDLAESGGDDRDLGDVGLEDAEWGPSFGYGQIRTERAQTGTGQDRDINWLATSDYNQAKAQFDISQGGRNFTPWTTYTSGKYRQFLGQAQAAAAGAGGTAGATQLVGNSSGPFPTFGPWWLPWNYPSDIGNGVAGQVTDAAGSLLGGVRQIAVEGLFVVLGLGLVGVGLAQALKPQLRQAKATAQDKGRQAAEVAALAA